MLHPIDVIELAPRRAFPETPYFIGEVRGDCFCPTYRPGTVFIAIPCHVYDGEGIYAFNDDGVYFWRAQRAGSKVRLWRDNRKCGRQTVSLDWFNTNVTGKVASACAAV